jgi:ATP-dependent DNA helicase RecG
LKGVGPLRGDLLKKELGIFTFNDLLHHFPYRHIDKTHILKINELNTPNEYAQVQGILIFQEVLGEKMSKRLVAYLKDETGTLELTWFKGISWVQKILNNSERYTVFGKVSFFMGQIQMIHPEIEIRNEASESKNLLEPVYSTTEKLRARGLGGRQIGKLVQALIFLIKKNNIPENLPENILKKGQLIPRFDAYINIHFPKTMQEYDRALRRLKFEELFITQLRLALIRSERHRFSKGVLFKKVGEYFNTFYKQHLPFELTGAQKRVLKEIRIDTDTGHQMNRLLQGDVGSGKTIVALLTMLLAMDNGFQCCLMAPTEILAQQHFVSITRLLKDIDIGVHLLTGSTKAAQRKHILKSLMEGSSGIVIGTHALIEEVVQFQNLGLANVAYKTY